MICRKIMLWVEIDSENGISANPRKEARLKAVQVLHAPPLDIPTVMTKGFG